MGGGNLLKCEGARRTTHASAFVPSFVFLTILLSLKKPPTLTGYSVNL